MARMGRPLAMAVGVRKEAIYAAAETLFCERGYEKVAMSDIAAAAGMSKRTLYLLFADKEELLRNLISSSYIWPDEVFGAKGDNAIAELRLRLRVIANHVLSRRHISLCRLAISESIGMHGLADAFLEMGIQRSRNSLVASLKKIERNRLRIDLSPNLLAGMIYGATCGYNMMVGLLTGRVPDLKTVYANIDEVISKTFVE